MAYNYDELKKAYQAMSKEQQQQFASQNMNNANFQQFAKDYAADTNRNNTVATPTVTNTAKQGISNITSPYQNQGEGNYTYNPVSGYYENNSKPQTNQYTDYSKYNNTNSNNSDFYGQNNQYQGNASTINTLGNMATDLFNQGNKGYSDLMGGSNYADNFDDAVNNKLKSAFGLNNLNELKNKYPEQYESVVQALESVRGVRDATDPTQRQMLDGYLQGIIGSGVGAGSDMSKLNVLNQTLMDKFKNGEQVAEDMRNIVKLQTEGMSTSEIASKMGISEDQVQQAILAYNGLDNKLGEYYQLKDGVAKDITEPYDKQLARLDEEKKIALERANRQVDWLKQDFDTALERQKQQNDINAHNADAIAGRTGLAFSKRGIEGLNYVAEQARQIIDDITKNYDRNNQNLADGIADIIRNWQRNNEDLMKASQDALTAAKNNFTSNMLAVQQQYGTVGLQAQQALANNVQGFIEQAQNIYDNALVRQQQNLTNLINNVSNINALEAQNLTMRNAKIQQFQAESMNLNRNQLQGLAQQLGMDTGSYQDLVNYQVQAVANELNGYMPGAGVQFQSQIQSYLDQGYTPTQAMQAIMNTPEFKAATTQSATRHNAGNGWLYDDLGNTKFIEGYGDISGISGTAGGTGGESMGNYGSTSSYVSSTTVNGQSYGVSENTYYGLQDFVANHAVGTTGGQCGKFVNDYLQSLGLDRIFTDPITDKKAQINTPEGYKPQVGDVVIMDSPTSRKYGHVAIVTAVDGDKITTLESNKKGEGEVFSRTIDTSKQNRLGGQIFGYYHPDGVAQANGIMGGTAMGGTEGATSNGLASDSGTPYAYSQRIYNLVSATLKNSEKEAQRIFDIADTAYKGGLSAEDGTLLFFGIDASKDKTGILKPLADAIRKSGADIDDTFRGNLGAFSENGKAADAVKLVENNALKSLQLDDYKNALSEEQDAIFIAKQVNKINNLLADAENKVGPFDGRLDKYINKLVGDEKYSKLGADLKNAYASLSNKLMGANMSEHEIAYYSDIIPQMNDQASTIRNKLQSTLDRTMDMMNASRATAGVPELQNIEQLLDYSKRVNLYSGQGNNNGVSAINYLANQLNNKTNGRISAGGTMVAGNRF